MAKIINIEYPDNTIHSIICNRLLQVEVDGEVLYVLEATDRSKGNSGAVIVLERIGGIFYKRPLGSNDDYRRFLERIQNLPLYSINVLELPNDISIHPSRKFPQSGSPMSPNPRRAAVAGTSPGGPPTPPTALTAAGSPPPPGPPFVPGSPMPPTPPSSSENVKKNSQEGQRPVFGITVYRGSRHDFGSEYYIESRGNDLTDLYAAGEYYERLRYFIKRGSYMPITKEEFDRLKIQEIKPIEDGIKTIDIFTSPNGMRYVLTSEILGTPGRIKPFKNYYPITKAEYLALKLWPNLIVTERLLNFPLQPIKVYYDSQNNTYYLTDYVWNSIHDLQNQGDSVGSLVAINGPEMLELLNGCYAVSVVPILAQDIPGTGSNAFHV